VEPLPGFRRRSIIRRSFVALALAGCLAFPVEASEDPVKLLAGMEAAYAMVRDYTARFERQERVGGALRPREEIFLKFKRPGRIYLKWLSGPSRGREAILAEGDRGRKAVIHEPGVLSGFFTLLLDPDHPRVMRESRHPITDVGIGRLIELIGDNARRALARGELALVSRGEGEEDGRRVKRVEAILPRDASKGYYCYRLLLFVDAERALPVRAMIYDWDDRLIGDYSYRELSLNPGLSAEEFDPGNPTYGFPRWKFTLSR
jgi:hypothetical protein